MKKTLLLFTEDYPYGKGETFLETEINYLSTAFDRIFVFPRFQKGVIRDLPKNVEVKHIYTTSHHISKYLLYLNGLHFVINHFILIKKVKLDRYFHVLGYLKSIKYLGVINLFMKDIQNYLKHSSLSLTNCIFYTYWLGYTTFALGLLKSKNSNIKLVSRVHGYDLYEERGDKSLTFIKYSNILLLDKLYCISKDGRNYLAGKFPEFKEKFGLERLGTSDPGFEINIEDQGNFKIVSCSGLTEVKRVDRIINALNIFSEKFPEFHLEWHHVGDGNLKEELIAMAKILNEGSVKYTFHGYIPNYKLLDFYKRLQPDLFINLSQSEGLPVSIMEAQSIGLPVMAANVGGVSEIVNNENGLLLSANPSADEITNCLKEILDINVLKYKSKKSHENWEAKFKATKAFPHFIKQLEEN